MAQIMAHNIIPIRFRFIKIPVAWDLSVNARVGPVVRGRLGSRKSPEQVRLAEIDGWQCRDEFFSIPDNDVGGFTRFLNKIGVWSQDSESAAFDWSRYPLFVHLDDVWRFRQDLMDALLHRKEFAARFLPVQQRPGTLVDLMRQTDPANQFPLSFEVAKLASGVVTVTNGRMMLLATVLADVARGIRFKACKRKDCRKPFSIESRHKRDYCGQPCAHLESVRKKRAESRKGKK
jgi:hypothetical protein